MSKKKEILTVCLNCGKKWGTKTPGIIGVWSGTCDICHKENVSCASAPHDFKIYSSEKIRIADKFQDLL